jgi:hypothetical protein
MAYLSVRRGSIRGTWRGGSFSGNFGTDVNRDLEMEDLPLRKGSVRGTWKGGFLFWEL